MSIEEEKQMIPMPKEETRNHNIVTWKELLFTFPPYLSLNSLLTSTPNNLSVDFGVKLAWIRILPLPLACCITLSEIIYLNFFICKRR